MTDTKTVLIFEDSDADFFLLKAMFEDIRTDDYTLIRAEGLDDFDAHIIHSIDLVIMDYQFPQDTGLNIIEQLQNMFGNFAPIIFLTGYDNPQLYKQLRSLNVYDHFIKEEMTASLLERSCFYAIERFITNERYRREREFSQYLAENLPYIIVKIDLQGNLEKYNDNFLRLQKDLKEQESCNDQDLIDLFKSKQPQFNFDYSKGPMKYHTKWTLIHSQFDDAITYIGEDITTEMNERKSEMGRKKLEALGHLAGGIAHELNNTLQPIILRNDLIKDIGIRLDNNDLIDHAYENSLMLKHGAAIIRDILDFSNSKDANNLAYNENIAPMFQSVISIIQKSLPDTIQININHNDPLTGCPIIMNENDLLKILSNIIHNAALSMNMDGIIDITTTMITTDGSKKFFDISIKDHGCGMPDHLIGKIFSPFFTTRAPGAGTGLGMSVTHSLIIKYDGDIQVQSTEGIGTIVQILLPISQDL